MFSAFASNHFAPRRLCFFRLGFVSVSSRFRLGFVSVLRVLGVRLESLRTSTPVLFFRSNETFVALFGVKMDDNNCKASRCEVFRGERREHGAPRRKRHRRRGAKCFEANAENTEHLDENLIKHTIRHYYNYSNNADDSDEFDYRG